METLKLNNTPVRTSRNFGINNIELKDIELPEDLKEFKNVEIINEGCSLEKVYQIKSQCMEMAKYQKRIY